MREDQKLITTVLDFTGETVAMSIVAFPIGVFVLLATNSGAFGQELWIIKSAVAIATMSSLAMTYDLRLLLRSRRQQGGVIMANCLGAFFLFVGIVSMLEKDNGAFGSVLFLMLPGSIYTTHKMYRVTA